MRARAITLLAGSGAVLFLGCSPGDAEPGDLTAEEHLSAAQVAAGQEHVALLNRLCTQVTTAATARAAASTGQTPATAAAPPSAPASTGQAPPAPAARTPGPPPRSAWYAEPVKVFDNLYFVGQTRYTAWAVTTSEGIIIIDPLFDYSVEAEVADGLTKLGLDPETIRYVIVSHGHRDHVGGARYLQDRFGARVILGAADWDLLDSSGGDWPKPRRDIVAEDGYELRLGETTLVLHLTPGHTPGTISTLIPVTDGGRRHMAALWGGTAFNFMGRSGEARWFGEYVGSAERFRDLAEAAGADVLLSNHPQYDGSTTKLPALAVRGAGDPHPYVIGSERVGRYLTVAQECAAAGLLGVG